MYADEQQVQTELKTRSTFWNIRQVENTSITSESTVLNFLFFFLLSTPKNLNYKSTADLW